MSNPVITVPNWIESGPPGTIASLNPAGTGVIYTDIKTGAVVGTGPLGPIPVAWDKPYIPGGPGDVVMVRYQGADQWMTRGEAQEKGLIPRDNVYVPGSQEAQAAESFQARTREAQAAWAPQARTYGDDYSKQYVPPEQVEVYGRTKLGGIVGRGKSGVLETFPPSLFSPSDIAMIPMMGGTAAPRTTASGRLAFGPVSPKEAFFALADGSGYVKLSTVMPLKEYGWKDGYLTSSAQFGSLPMPLKEYGWKDGYLTSSAQFVSLSSAGAMHGTDFGKPLSAQEKEMNRYASANIAWEQGVWGFAPQKAPDSFGGELTGSFMTGAFAGATYGISLIPTFGRQIFAVSQGVNPKTAYMEFGRESWQAIQERPMESAAIIGAGFLGAGIGGKLTVIRSEPSSGARFGPFKVVTAEMEMISGKSIRTTVLGVERGRRSYPIVSKTPEGWEFGRYTLDKPVQISEVKGANVIEPTALGFSAQKSMLALAPEEHVRLAGFREVGEATQFVRGVKPEQVSRNIEAFQYPAKSVPKVMEFVRKEKMEVFGTAAGNTMVPAEFSFKHGGSEIKFQKMLLKTKDVDIQSMRQTEFGRIFPKVEKLVGRLNLGGENMKINMKETTAESILVESKKGGKWVHALDIKLQGTEPPGIMGFDIEKKPVKVEGTKITRLGEQILRTGQGAFRFKGGEKGFIKAQWKESPPEFQVSGILPSPQRAPKDIARHLLFGSAARSLLKGKKGMRAEIGLGMEFGSYTPGQKGIITKFMKEETMLEIPVKNKPSIRPPRIGEISKGMSLSAKIMSPSASFSRSFSLSPSKTSASLPPSMSRSLSVSPSLSRSLSVSPSKGSKGSLTTSISRSISPSRSPSPYSRSGSSSSSPWSPSPPPPPPSYSRSITLPSGSRRAFFPRSVMGPQAKRYMPSFAAQLLNIRGGMPKQKMFTGFEIRPLIAKLTGRKRRKRR